MRKSRLSNQVLRFACALLLFTALAGCQSRRELAGINEIGGDPASFSCDVVAQQLEIAVPRLKEAEERAVALGCLTEAQSQSTGGAGDSGGRFPGEAYPAMGLGESGSGGQGQPQVAQEAQGRCAEIETYVTAQQTYIKQLTDRRDNPRDPCPKARENYTMVFDFPTCGVGNECSDRYSDRRGSSCWNCQYAEFEKSRITCQSEDAGRDAVQIWCRRNNQNCGEVRGRSLISCNASPGIDPSFHQENPRTSGQMTYDSRVVKTSVYFSTEVNVKAGVESASASATAKVKAGLDIDLGYEVVNETDEPTWVKRGDRVEAGYRTKYRCNLVITAAGAVGVEGSGTFGLSFLGNGVTSTTTGGVAGEIKGSRWTVNRSLTAAGKTADQMRDDCVAYLTPQLQQIAAGILASVGLAERIKVPEAGGKVCLEDKECPNSEWQRWTGRCAKSAEGLTVGNCKYFQTVGGQCNVSSEPPCDIGTKCELQSWMSFLGYKFNKRYVCRQVYR